MNAALKARLQSKGAKIAYGIFLLLILVAIGLYFFAPSGSKENKNNPKTIPTLPAPLTPVDSTLRKSLDDLSKQFKDYQLKNDERLDSLLNPTWYRELDQKSFENKNKGAK